MESARNLQDLAGIAKRVQNATDTGSVFERWGAIFRGGGNGEQSSRLTWHRAKPIQNARICFAVIWAFERVHFWKVWNDWVQNSVFRGTAKWCPTSRVHMTSQNASKVRANVFSRSGPSQKKRVFDESFGSDRSSPLARCLIHINRRL